MGMPIRDWLFLLGLDGFDGGESRMSELLADLGSIPSSST